MRWLALLLLSACYPPNGIPDGYTSCGMSVFDISVDKVAEQELVTLSVYSQFYSYRKMCEALKGSIVHLEDPGMVIRTPGKAPYWLQNGRPALGSYQRETNTVTLAEEAWPSWVLVHELTHLFQARIDNVVEYDHGTWVDRGFYKAIDAVAAKSNPLTVSLVDSH